MTIIISMFKFLKDNFSWVKDVAIVLFMVVVLYLNAHFVTIDKFEVYVKANDLAHEGIQVTLVSVDKTLALMQQNQASLVEHDKQIKINTSRLADIEGRLKYSDENAKMLVAAVIKAAEVDTRLKTIEALEMDKHIKRDSERFIDYEIRLKMIEMIVNKNKIDNAKSSP